MNYAAFMALDHKPQQRDAQEVIHWIGCFLLLVWPETCCNRIDPIPCVPLKKRIPGMGVL
jgi:hypothetical protein